MGIYRILKSFRNTAELSLITNEIVTKYLKLKDVGQRLKWEKKRGGGGRWEKIEKEGERRVRTQANAFMSFQSSLSHKGLLREICRL